MVYDKDSFLAGLAVGRNLESWPAFEGNQRISRFSYEVELRQGREYVWGIESLFPHGGMVFWGDGTVETIEASSVSPTLRHDYPTTGPYLITVLGMENFLRMGDDAADRVTRILTPFPAVRVDPKELFLGYWRLSYLPPGLFSNTLDKGSYTDFTGILEACQSMTYIPADIFAGFSPTNVTNAFRDMNHTGATYRPVEIPVGLLAGCTDLVSAYGMFLYTAITGIPADLFADCSQLINVGYAFATDDFYDHYLEAIPSGLFANCPLINNFESTFSAQRNITGPLPELWITHPNAQYHYGTFGGCWNASNYNDVPSDWK